RTLITHSDYDGLNRRIDVIADYARPVLDDPIPLPDALPISYIQAKTSMVYDADGNVTDVTDPRKLITHSDYDGLNRRIDVIADYGTIGATNPNTGATYVNAKTAMAYDPDGNATDVSDPRSIDTHYVYDGLNRRTGATQDYSMQ